MDELRFAGETVWFQSSRTWPVAREALFEQGSFVPLLESEVPFDYGDRFGPVVFLWDRETGVAVATTIWFAQADLLSVGSNESLEALALEYRLAGPPVERESSAVGGSVEVDVAGLIGSGQVSDLTVGQLSECCAVAATLEFDVAAPLSGDDSAMAVQEVDWVTTVAEEPLCVTLGYVSMTSGTSSPLLRVEVPEGVCAVAWPKVVGSAAFDVSLVVRGAVVLPRLACLSRVAIYGFSAERVIGHGPTASSGGVGAMALRAQSCCAESWSQAPGYCYAVLMKAAQRARAMSELGPLPSLRDLLAIPFDWFDARALRDAGISLSGETLHVDKGVGMSGECERLLTHCATDLLGASEHECSGGGVGWALRSSALRVGGLSDCAAGFNASGFVDLSSCDKGFKSSLRPLSIARSQSVLLPMARCVMKRIYLRELGECALVVNSVNNFAVGLLPFGPSTAVSRYEVVSGHVTGTDISGFAVEGGFGTAAYSKLRVWNPIHVLRGVVRIGGRLDLSLSDYMPVAGDSFPGTQERVRDGVNACEALSSEAGEPTGYPAKCCPG